MRHEGVSALPCWFEQPFVAVLVDPELLLVRAADVGLAVVLELLRLAMLRSG